MAGLGFIVSLEGFVSGSNQIRFSLNTMNVIVNNSTTALAKLFVYGPFNAHEFFGGQLWQDGFDFRNRTHASTITGGPPTVNRVCGPCPLTGAS
jgi:hypothetical protein